MRDEHGLTIKQRKAADGILAGMSDADAVKAAGYQPGSESALRVQGYRLASHPNVRQYILDALEANGVTPNALSHRLFQLIHTEDPDDNIGAKRISLDAVKEAHKVLGAHAPTESRKLQVTASYQGRSTAELRYMAQHGRRPSKAELAEIEGKADE